jgi:regulator of replication initiation timing
MKIYARNDETSFLTKYLRAYGGQGTYENFKVARVLRNFRFCGMGNVDTPANPASEYTKVDDYVLASISDLKKDSKVVFYITKGNIMKIETLEQALAEIDSLQKKLEGKDTDTLQASLTKAQTDLETEKNKVSLATQEVNTLKTELDQLKKDLEQVKADLKTKTEELDAIAKNAKSKERLAQLKECGFEVVDENKQKSYSEMSDDAFASILDFAKQVKSKKDTNTNDASAVADATNKAKSDLQTDNKGDKTADVTQTAGDDNKEGDTTLEKTAAKLADFLTKNRKNGRKSKKTE